MKTNQLTGAALDWAVAKCDDKVDFGVYGSPVVMDGRLHLHYCGVVLHDAYSPSTNWAHGGPIIETMGMHISRTNKTDKEPWAACMTHWIDGETPLIAAMRCYVAYRLGDEVEIPTELTQGEKN